MLVPIFWLRSTGFPFEWLELLSIPVSLDCNSGGSFEEVDFRKTLANARLALARFFTDPLCAEAIFLSNPQSLDRVVALASSDMSRVDARARQRLRLAWSYLQRFCAKNDTNSFFGPIACGRLNPNLKEILKVSKVDPKLGWLLSRHVYFEHWVVDRICLAITHDFELSKALPLQVNPSCDLEGGLLLHPVGKSRLLQPSEVEFIKAVLEGKSTARTLASQPESRRLLAAGIVRTILSVAPGASEPMSLIRSHLLNKPGAKAAAFSALTESLEASRAEYESTGLQGRQQLLREMVSALDAIGIDTHRSRGEMYVGRLPVYEDCGRNLQVEIGAEFAKKIEQGLEPVLQLFRTVAQSASALLNHHYGQIMETLPNTLNEQKDFIAFISASRNEYARAQLEKITNNLREIIEQAWVDIVCLREGDEVVVSEADLKSIAFAVASIAPEYKEFAGVLGVGIASPDIMIAARDFQSLKRGSYQIILGEIHPCVPTALQPVALPFFHSTEVALQFAQKMLAPGRILLAGTSQNYHRSQIDWPVVENLWEIVLPGATSRCPAEQQIPAGRGRVFKRDEKVEFHDRVTGRSEDMVSVLSSDLHRIMFALARSILGGALGQRIVHNGIVLKRRSWTFEAGQLPRLSGPTDSLASYLALRDWARYQKLPRHMFLVAEDEEKPIYFDWDSPLSLDLFVKVAKRVSRFLVSEMTPTPDELWLSDARGRYCCELRMTFTV